MNENASSSTKGTSKDTFTILAVFYLALPNILFLATWVTPWIGLPCAFIVAYCCVKLVEFNGNVSTQKLDRNTWVFIIFLALFWTAMTGAGGFIPQCQGEDYTKHNLLFNDLIHNDWPVVYDTDGGGKSFLCYSLAYHLVPAFFARTLGENWISVASFLWTFLGICLFFFWVAKFNRKAPVRTLLIFLFFAELGIVWFALRNSGWRGQLALLGINFNYPDWWTKFAFSPQHALPAWLGSALLYDMVWLRRNTSGAFLVWTMTLLWSPFTPLGLLLVPLLALPGVGIRGFFKTSNLLGGGIMLVIIAIYYKAHAVIDSHGWIWSLATNTNWLFYYIFFVCVQVALPALCVFLIDRKYNVLQNLKPVFLGATAFLILFPLYKMGYYSDLRQQGSGSPLVFVSLSVAACLTSERFSLRKPLFLLLLIMFFVGAFYPLARPLYCIVYNKHDYSIQSIRQSTGMADLSQFRSPDFGFDASAQYMGKTDSLAYKYLLKH